MPVFVRDPGFLQLLCQSGGGTALQREIEGGRNTERERDACQCGAVLGDPHNREEERVKEEASQTVSRHKLLSDAEFPFNEERVIPDGVNRDSAIIGGIIAVVIFTILCTLVFLIRYMFRHKGTYHTNEAKGSGESAAESADTAIIGTDNPETIDESKKEWFI
uniref:Neurexin/syndecan/glycophorin C domain-containing protein n=1 Tax=Amphiprion ocellaris TaxID=80972 RepID=A0AAQ5YR65_AMPOC